MKLWHWDILLTKISLPLPMPNSPPGSALDHVNVVSLNSALKELAYFWAKTQNTFFTEGLSYLGLLLTASYTHSNYCVLGHHYITCLLDAGGEQEKNVKHAITKVTGGFNTKQNLEQTQKSLVF